MIADGRFKKGQVAHNKVDLSGRVLGRWTVLSKSEHDRHYNCRCDCGNEREVFGPSLVNGSSTSCGCMTRSVFASRWVTHGHARVGTRSREYETWCRIRARCENERNPGFKDYGGRGIAMCERWRSSFNAFLADMGYRPGPGYSIDRIDVNGNYEPGNCRWATPKQQCRNRRTNHMMTIGSLTKTLAEWSELSGVSGSTILRRRRDGWSDDRLLIAPVKPGPSKLAVN